MVLWSLERLARPSNHSWSVRPFGLKVGRSLWNAATDGKWFVGMAGQTALAEPAWDADQQRRFLTFFRQPRPEDAVSSDLSDLRAWAGEVPLLGEPFEMEAQRPGVAADIVIDLRRLAAILTSAPDDGRVFIWNCTEAIDVSSVAFDVPGRWRAVLAGLNAQPEEEDDRFVPPAGTILDAFAHLE